MNLLVYAKEYCIHFFNSSFSLIKRNQLFRGASTSFGLKIASTGLGLITNVVLARLLGKEDLGIFIYALSWERILVIPATLGFRKLLVREISIYQTKAQWGEFHGLVKLVNRFTFFISICLALIAYFVSRVLENGTDPRILEALLLALFLLPIDALTINRTSILQGLKQIIRSQLPELLIAPIISLLFIGCLYVVSGNNLSVNYVLFSRIIAFYIAFYVGSRWLIRSLPSIVKQTQPKFYVHKWLSSAIPLMFLEGMRTIHHQTDALMLGAMQGPETVGIYAVLSKGVMLVVFILGSVDTAISPMIAKLYALGEIEKLQKIIIKSSRSVFVVSLMVTMAFIFLGHWFLMLFGQDFLAGQTALTILCIGKMIGALTTSSSFLLAMTGHERHIIVSASTCSVLNVILNFLFIPRWGIEGAAFATSISNVVMHFWNGFSVWKTTSVNPTPFNFGMQS